MGKYETLREELDNAEAIMAEVGNDNFNGSGAGLLWRSSCERTIWALYDGRLSQEAKTFRITAQPSECVRIVKGFLAVEEDRLRSLYSTEQSTVLPVSVSVIQTNEQRQEQQQTTSATQEFSMRLMVKIEHADGLTNEQKDEVKNLHAELLQELHKPDTNWQKVTGFLKRGLDYGLKIGPDLVKLADAYFNAKHLP